MRDDGFNRSTGKVYVHEYEGAQANNRVHMRKADKMKVKLQEVPEALEGAGVEEKWYKYRDACYEKIAREWCEKYGIEA